ncbi:hypothetical protein OF83DRAFT_1159484 [Amylostereum chailletii]|nr:hypothetical protein OF83DRAFT_1159484 [Amylostereum chailletii]
MPSNPKNTEKYNFDQDIRENVLTRPELANNRFIMFAPKKASSKSSSPRKKHSSSSGGGNTSKSSQPRKKSKISKTGGAESNGEDVEVKEEVIELEDSDGEDDGSSDDFEITVYIDVVATTPAPPPSWGKSTKKVATSVTHPCGPFFFNTSRTFSEFLQDLAVATPCPRRNLVVSKINWKFDKPQSASTKALTNDTGFAAMLREVKGRFAAKKDCELKVIMPVPVAQDNVVPWVTTDDEPAPSYDDKFTNVAAGVSMHDQILGLKANSKPTEQDIERKYPVGNNRKFPKMRVFEENGKYWELTPLRVQVWANHMHEDGVTLEKPPRSNHFAIDKCIKKVPKTPEPTPEPPEPTPTVKSSNAPPTVVTAPAPHAVPAPPHMSAFPHIPPYPMFYPGMHTLPAPPFGPMYPGYGPASLTYPYIQPHMPYGQNIGIHQHLDAPQPLFAGLAPQAPPMPPPLGRPVTPVAPPAPPAPPALPMPPQIRPTFISPKTRLRIGISLESFCDLYDVSESDHIKLQKLEVIPGEHEVEELKSQDWSDKAGFSTLGWGRFLEKHREFCKDVRGGRFDD